MELEGEDELDPPASVDLSGAAALLASLVLMSMVVLILPPAWAFWTAWGVPLAVATVLALQRSAGNAVSRALGCTAGSGIPWGLWLTSILGDVSPGDAAAIVLAWAGGMTVITFAVTWAVFAAANLFHDP